MCFSANMSLGAGVVLSAIGVAAISKAQKPAHVVFGSIPLIFAVQQIAEGFLWLTLPDPTMVAEQQFLTYIFLTFAQVIWPLWVPLAVMLLEKNNQRRKTQKVLVGIGMTVSFYLAYCLLTNQVQANIVGHHITYLQDYPMVLRPIGGVLYFVATIIPLFLSHIKKMWILGVMIFTSYIIAAMFYDHYVLSVWCFFASIISGSVYYIMVEIKKSETSLVVHSSFSHFNGGFAP
jgi:hypothetical protein